MERRQGSGQPCWPALPEQTRAPTAASDRGFVEGSRWVPRRSRRAVPPRAKDEHQIAAELFLSKNLETHLRNIFRKIGVSTRAELAGAVEHADHGARTLRYP